ncbi:MAG TPA: hypothetical protein VGQ09_14085 [Chitinophagaceae bacterium]|jgi:hypothetical protein|nr:hypothetical protein [Chitinophagaceae bacterium]
MLEKIIASYLKMLAACAFLCFFCMAALAQDNSPYSRYGLGDLTPNTNILNRGMGSFSAAYADPLSINFSNPASYSAFLSYQEQRSKKSASGRALFDVGINFDNHSLRESNNSEKFTSSNALFSYMQVGVPLKRNWGLSFGLRQISRISYKINSFERLNDPVTGFPIDSALTEFTGDGGTFLASAGTGFAIKNLSVGVNFGYLFGKKEYAAKRAFINDTVEYNSSNHTTKTSFGNIFLSAGIQYKIDLNKNYLLRLGAYGNLKQTMNAEQDVLRETFIRTVNGDVRLDSVFEEKNIKGKIIYPSAYGLGFIFEKKPDIQNNKYATWLIGVDFVQNNWSQYRFYGNSDLVDDSWELRLGAQIKPEPKKNYFSNVAFRGGFVVGQDYVNVVNKLPLWGISFGMGLPLPNYNRLALGQASIINLSFEYLKRGNNDNLLKENVFRISVGLSLSDLWFSKRKYE